MKTSFRFILLLALWLPSPASAGGGLAVEQGRFRVTLNDRILSQAELTGMTFALGEKRDHQLATIESVEDDPSAAGGLLTLYHITLRAGEGALPSELCAPDARGRRLGLPLTGRDGSFRFVCTSGAAGKCVLLGYRPWDDRPGLPMRDLHQACVHMIRADYGGDDRPATRDGTQIDVFDRFGIQTAADLPSMSFEAAWGPAGALCVAHPRRPEIITLAGIGERHPGLLGALGPEVCNLDTLRGNGSAILFNRSRQTPDP
jgi:hypothetical protein